MITEQVMLTGNIAIKRLEKSTVLIFPLNLSFFKLYKQIQIFSNLTSNVLSFL